MMTFDYDVIIIGAGPAGVSTATNLASNDYKVLVVDERIGGNYCSCGSVVSNALLHSSYLYNRFQTQTKNFIQFNVEPEPTFDFDFGKARKYVENLSNKVVKAYRDELNSDHIDTLIGRAAFVDESIVEVTTEDGVQTLCAEHYILATGSTNKSLDLPKVTKVLGVENIFNLTAVPASVAIIGGGFVGCEYATFFKRIGCDVTIIEKSGRILSSFDEQIVKKYEDLQKKNGVEIIKNRSVEKIEKIGNKSILFLTEDDKIEAEEVFVSVGREPNLSGLNIEAAKVKVQDDIPVLNAHFQSTNKKVFVIGDATGHDMLVNWAYRSGEIVANRIMGHRKRNKYEYMPRVLYVDPEIASIGFTDAKAKEAGFTPLTIKYSYTDLEKSLILDHSKIFMKVIYDKDSKKILGAHIIGRSAGELISVFALLIQSGIKIDSISEYIFNHPVFSEVLTELSNKYKEKSNP